jgi:selenocysteine-specific translation elongation factor
MEEMMDNYNELYDNMANARTILATVMKLSEKMGEGVRELRDKVMEADEDIADAMHEAIRIEVERVWEKKNVL